MRRHELALLLAVGCNDPRILAQGTAPDAAPTGDTGSPDAPTPGDPAAARLLSPISTSTVTQQQPTLRWVNNSTVGTPIVDLCADRACANPLAITATVLVDGASARPDAPLPPGWVYWRVRTTTDDHRFVSSTWQLWVGKASASTSVDSSSGTALDVNGDGYGDMVVGIAEGDTVNVYLGNPDGTNFERIDLVSPDGGTNLTEGCIGGGTCFGGTVSSIGDVNGDGYADFVVGTWNGLSGGLMHVYLGGPTPSQAGWNGTTAPQRIDLPGAFFWWGAIAPAGDVNGDGYADFIVTPSGPSGLNRLYLGSATPNATDWSGTTPPRVITLENPEAALSTYINFGPSSGVGDVNGDGYADFVVGAHSYDSSVLLSFAHVYLGGPNVDAANWNGTTAPARIDLVSPDSTTPFAGSFGAAIAGAGDVNGDGYTDFVIGAVDANTGAAHLFYGGPSRGDADWNGASATARVDLVPPAGEYFYAWSVTGGGDIDGDGYADFVVGSANDAGDDNPGAAHVYFGGPSRTVADWNGATSAARIDVSSPDGANSYFTSSLANVGDINGDGFADVVIGARGAGNYTGHAHVNYGLATPSAASWNGTTAPARLDLTNPNTTSSEFGWSVD